MLEKLTPEQEKLIPIIRDKWINLSLSGKLEYSKELTDGINWIYKKAKLKENPLIIISDSPYSSQVIANLLYKTDLLQNINKILKDMPKKLGDSVRASVRASVRNSVGDSVWDSVWDSVRDSVGASVGASVGDSVRASVGASVGDSVRASVRASVWDSVRASVWDSVRELAYGSHDAGCLSYYDYLYQVV